MAFRHIGHNIVFGDVNSELDNFMIKKMNKSKHMCFVCLFSFQKNSF